MNIFNKKGSALLQVLIVSIIIATLAVFVLRLAITRTSTVAKTTEMIMSRTAVEGCYYEVNDALSCLGFYDDESSCGKVDFDGVAAPVVAHCCKADMRSVITNLKTAGIVGQNENLDKIMPSSPAATPYRCKTLGLADTDNNGSADNPVQVTVRTGPAGPDGMPEFIYEIDPVWLDAAL